MPKLKSSLHCHTESDDYDVLGYNTLQAITYAKNKGFDVIATTCHNFFLDFDVLNRYAKNQDILVIPGIEKTIENKHVLILNATKDSEKIKSFEDLKKYKKETPQCLVMAPHPFYPAKHSLQEHFFRHKDLFDAIEFSWFYSKSTLYFNKKADRVASSFNLPLVATGDVHILELMDKTYSIIDARQKNISSVLDAIKANKIEIVTSPVFLPLLPYYLSKLFWISFKARFKKRRCY